MQSEQLKLLQVCIECYMEVGVGFARPYPSTDGEVGEQLEHFQSATKFIPKAPHKRGFWVLEGGSTYY